MKTEEADLQAEVTALCDDLGLEWRHDTDPRRSPAGRTDLLIVGPRGHLFVELKSTTGRRTRAQIREEQRLTGLGFVYRLWRPEHMANGTIRNELEMIA